MKAREDFHHPPRTPRKGPSQQWRRSVADAGVIRQGPRGVSPQLQVTGQSPDPRVHPPPTSCLQPQPYSRDPCTHRDITFVPRRATLLTAPPPSCSHLPLRLKYLGHSRSLVSSFSRNVVLLCVLTCQEGDSPPFPEGRAQMAYEREEERVQELSFTECPTLQAAGVGYTPAEVQNRGFNKVNAQ